jgi:hypothetical protein
VPRRLIVLADGPVDGGDAVVGAGLLVAFAGLDGQAERLGMAGARPLELPGGPQRLGQPVGRAVSPARSPICRYPPGFRSRAG